MMLRLLLLLAVLSLAQALTPCGSYHRICGLNASCVNDRCKCDEGFFGAPLVECARSLDQFQCVIQADPHATGFADAKDNLNYPCKYRMTRVQTPLENGTQFLSGCSFEVFGFNKIIGSRYFTSGMEISFAIGDLANQIFQKENIIKFDFNEQGVANVDGLSTEWGTGVHDNWKGVDIYCLFDDDNRLAILSIPRCGFRATFRPFNKDEPHGPQSQVPAISIVVDNTTIFGANPLGEYPSSLCGMTHREGNDNKLYKNRATELGLHNASQALLYDALNQNLQQKALNKNFTNQVLQNKDLCQATVDEFQDCNSDAKKSEAVKQCSAIMMSGSLAKCMLINVLQAFRGCVKAVCGVHASGCSMYTTALSAASCDGPESVTNFC